MASIFPLPCTNHASKRKCPRLWCGHRTRREHSLTKAAAPPEQHPTRPPGWQLEARGQGCPSSSPKALVWQWARTGRSGRGRAAGPAPSRPRGTTRRLREIQGRGRRSPGKEPPFLLLESCTTNKARDRGLCILSAHFEHPAVRGRCVGSRVGARRGPSSSAFVLSIFLFFSFFYVADAGFPRTLPAPHKLFFFPVFFSFLTRSFEKQRFDAKRCPDEMWEEPGLAAGECCYSSD